MLYPAEPIQQGSDGLICLGPIILFFVVIVLVKIVDGLSASDDKEDD